MATGSATLTYAPAHVKKSLAGAIGSASDSIFNTATDLNRITGTWDKNTAAYAKSFIPALDEIDQFFGGANNTVSGFETSVNEFYANVLNSVRRQASGFSSHLGAIIGGLDGMARDPLNPKNLSNCAAAIMNAVSPGSANSLNQSIQNLHLDKLAKAPGLLFSSVQRLAKAIDNILSIPIAFASKIYFGAINLIRRIGTLINNLIQGFQQFLFDFLDQIIPLTEILQLLNSIGNLASQIQGIASIFAGTNIISGFALQINNLTTQINSVITNPLDTVLGVLPTDIANGYSQIMYNLQNPQNLINQFLPAELSDIFSRLSTITGFGFNGNMGYGLASILEGLQGGVINSILTEFASQYNILGPLLAGSNYTPPISYTPTTNNGYIQGKRYRFNPNTNLYEV